MSKWFIISDFFFFLNELQEAGRLAIEKGLKICDNLEYLVKTMREVAYHGKIKIALVELRFHLKLETKI